MKKMFWISNVVFFTAVAVCLFSYLVTMYGLAYILGIDMAPQISIVPNIVGTIILFIFTVSFGLIFELIGRWKDRYPLPWEEK